MCPDWGRQKESGYHRQRVFENAIFGYKSMLGDTLLAGPVRWPWLGKSVNGWALVGAMGIAYQHRKPPAEQP